MRDKIEFLRADLMRVAVANNKGHIAPSLSCLEILAVLRYRIMGPDDVLILSKAHGCYGLYAIDADQGRLSKDDWENWRMPGTYEGLGALGHGLPIGAGIAFGKKLQSLPGHVFVIVGDGELQEGSNWEALSFIKHHGLAVTVIVDDNHLQAIEPTKDVMHQHIFSQFRGWGFEPRIIDGHRVEEIFSAWENDYPVIIARTIKGKGFPAMEGVAKFHYRIPTETEREPCK
ncbi:MAG: 1-deoxy-D-xylulose-5-phosphate synthase N-terminal domain-containing protein [Candidatus Pacebacteria bacterium]|nr:1-deoxy-D-xylulose-5-phosphate synthase N-terminal domain-containing protein [Candidatus Paceibacterota bacterium]